MKLLYILIALRMISVYLFGYNVGYIIGLYEGIVSVTTHYQVQDIQTYLNISQNITDSILMEISLE